MIPIITRPTKEETRKYSKLQADCKELEIPYIKAKVIAKVFGKDGKLISDHEQFGHSFTRNFYNCVLSTMGLKNATDVTFGAGLISGKSTAGAIVDGLWSLGGSGGGNFDTPTGYGFADGAGDNTFGIQVGTGTNPESFEDYVLQTLCGNGTGANQFAYAAENIPVAAYTAGTKTWTITHSRFFNNNSAGSIVVTESSLVSKTYTSAGFPLCLYSRDVLSPAQTVVVAGQLYMAYVLTIVFPN